MHVWNKQFTVYATDSSVYMFLLYLLVLHISLPDPNLLRVKIILKYEKRVCWFSWTHNNILVFIYFCVLLTCTSKVTQEVVDKEVSQYLCDNKLANTNHHPFVGDVYKGKIVVFLAATK